MKIVINLILSIQFLMPSAHAQALVPVAPKNCDAFLTSTLDLAAEAEMPRDEVMKLLAIFIDTGLVAGDLHDFIYLISSDAAPLKSALDNIHPQMDYMSDYHPARFQKSSLENLASKLNDPANETEHQALADKMTLAAIKFILKTDVREKWAHVTAGDNGYYKPVLLDSKQQANISALKLHMLRPGVHRLLGALYFGSLKHIANRSEKRSGGLVSRIVAQTGLGVTYTTVTSGIFVSAACGVVGAMAFDPALAFAGGIAGALASAGIMTQYMNTGRLKRWAHRITNAPRELICTIGNRKYKNALLNPPQTRATLADPKNVLAPYKFFYESLIYEVTKRYSDVYTRNLAELSPREVSNLVQENIFLSQIAVVLLREQMNYSRQLNANLPEFLSANFPRFEKYSPLEADRRAQIFYQLQNKIEEMESDANRILGEFDSQIAHAKAALAQLDDSQDNNVLKQRLSASIRSLAETRDNLKAEVLPAVSANADMFDSLINQSQLVSFSLGTP